MKKDTVNKKDKKAEEPIVIADECGDSMWDAVLEQEVAACQITNVTHKRNKLINKIETEQVVENNNIK